MAEQFYTILTNVGKAKIANSNVFNNKLNLTKFQVGDGGGGYYNPTEEQTKLKNKVWEGNINSIKIDSKNPNWIVIEVIIPSSQGGFMVREAGILDDENNLIAIGKYPETYKPTTSDGSSKDLFIRMILEISNVQNVTLKVDPTVIMATKKDIQVLESKFINIDDRVSKIEENIYKDKIDEIKTDVSCTFLKDCNGGFVSLEKVQGATYNNLSKFTAVNTEGNNYYIVSRNEIKSRTVTIINFTGRIIKPQIYKGTAWVSAYSIKDIKTTIVLKDGEDIRSIYAATSDGWTEQNKNDLMQIMILDGTVTGQVNGYWEGLKHVGEEIVNPDGTKAYRIETLSKTQNLAKLDSLKTYLPYHSFKINNDNIIIDDIKFVKSILTIALNNKPENKKYTVSGIMKINGKAISNSFFINKTANTYNSKTDRFEVNESTGYFSITETYNGGSSFFLHTGVNANPGDTITIEQLQIEEGTGTDYKKYDENKTEILSPQPLSQYDSVDMEGVIHLSSYSETFDGSEPGWTIYSDKKNTFTIKLRNVSKEGICDKYNTINNTDFDKKTGFYAASSASLIICDMTCSSLADFKAKLQSNPITVTYQQCDNNFKIIYREINTNKTLNLKGYENGYFECRSGAIQPSVTLTYATNLIKRIISTEEALKDVATQLGGTWKSLLSLADRELRMKSINLLTTETTIDLKNKVNEILNIWR